MQKPSRYVGWLAALCLLCLTGAAATAGDTAKPFAEKKVVLQISDEDAAKQTLVLNVAGNLLKYYGPDRIDVEIVAFGPGLRLLFADNSNGVRIDRLAADSGVRFSACGNTLAKVTEALGHAPALNPNAHEVEAGVIRIMELVEQGYLLIKP